MIRRNVADQPILIGPLLATDGTAQTSGAAIAVRKDGVASGSAAGTLTHVDGGVWEYIPTASETDANVVGLILTKSGAVAVPVTLVTTQLPTQSTLTLVGGGVRVDSLTAAALASISAEIASAGAAGMTVDTVLVTVSTPSDRLIDPDNNQLTEITVGQALTAVLAATIGDRSGVGTRTIVASLPGVDGATITAARISLDEIQGTTVVPAAS